MISLLFNMLSMFVIAFLPKSKPLNFMATVTIHSDLKAQENKICYYFHFFPIYLPWILPKGNQSWIFIGRTDAKAETPILWPPDANNWLIWKDPDAGKDRKWEEKETTEDEMAGWHHRLNGPWVWVNSGSWWWTGRAGMLQSMRSQRVGHNWVTELICHEVMGPDAMILVFWMLSFTPNFTLYFTLIKRLLSSSLVSAVWVISSAYLRLLIFLLTTLVPACDSFRLAFHMMYSACKLNK